MPDLRGALALDPVPRHWHCPACGRTSTTTEREPHAQLHPCSKTKGLLTPYIPAGTPGKVSLIQRDDYERHAGLRGAGRHLGENLRRGDDGRPYTGVTVEYADTAHTLLFVPGIEISMRGPR